MRQKFKDMSLNERRKRLFSIIEVGYDTDLISRGYDFVSMMIILINLAANILETFTVVEVKFGGLIVMIETITSLFFAVDCLMRIWTAKFLYPNDSDIKAALKYLFSFTGIVDVFSSLPFFLPFFFPAGAVAFRMFRVVRILRLFRVNAYYDSLNVIAEVISDKKQQLLSSVFIILVLMLAASLCMYSLEHEAQPEVFQNAFSGIWWSVSTLLTVGYGDIYPITTVGRMFSIVITFLGVGMVAIPTGIISAGFVDQYSRAQQVVHTDLREHETDLDVHEADLHAMHPWIGKYLMEVDVTGATVFLMVKRGERCLAPDKQLVLREGDIVSFYLRQG